VNDKEFWDLIAWANAQGEDEEDREDALEDALCDLSPEAIEDFFLVYDRQVTAAWTPDVALLAYLVNRYGDRSAYDDLLDFICWLIDRGRAVYQAALSDPDRLADVEDELPWESQGYWRNAAIAWEMETGSNNQAFYDRVGERGASGPEEYPGSGGVVDADELRRRWPRLCQRFIDERADDDEV
jgi:hypothetical protein